MEMTDKEILKFGYAAKATLDVIVTSIQINGISAEKLDAYQRHLERTEAVGPLLNPNQFVGGKGFAAIDTARRRIIVLQQVVDFMEIDKALQDKNSS